MQGDVHHRKYILTLTELDTRARYPGLKLLCLTQGVILMTGLISIVNLSEWLGHGFSEWSQNFFGHGRCCWAAAPAASSAAPCEVIVKNCQWERRSSRFEVGARPKTLNTIFERKRRNHWPELTCRIQSVISDYRHQEDHREPTYQRIQNSSRIYIRQCIGSISNGCCCSDDEMHTRREEEVSWKSHHTGWFG